ncbi:MAG: hypothetical protein Fur0022_27720 [Anaerolineales bacterium]
MTTQIRTIKTKPNFETTAWKWMRYSGVLLIPLVWIHVLIQDVIVGVHGIIERGGHEYVLLRWADPLWITYDILLLAFTFAHGMNGLRQVANDFIHDPKAQKTVATLIFVLWLVISIIGAFAIIAAAARKLASL